MVFSELKEHMSKKGKGLTPEDFEAFRKEMEDMHVDKLKKDYDKVQNEPEDYYELTGIPARRKQEATIVIDTELSMNCKEQYGPEDKLSYAGSGVQHKVLQKLKRGQLPIEAALDFHGMMAEEAANQLSWFLGECHARGIRVVRIIHGKGHRSQDNVPILKNLLNQWLKDRPDVLAFCSAQPRDGGAGAVYVLLKNMR